MLPQIETMSGSQSSLEFTTTLLIAIHEGRSSITQSLPELQDVVNRLTTLAAANQPPLDEDTKKSLPRIMQVISLARDMNAFRCLKPLFANLHREVINFDSARMLQATSFVIVPLIKYLDDIQGREPATDASLEVWSSAYNLLNVMMKSWGISTRDGYHGFPSSSELYRLNDQTASEFAKLLSRLGDVETIQARYAHDNC